MSVLVHRPRSLVAEQVLTAYSVPAGNGCRIWLGAPRTDGRRYGRVTIAGVTHAVHRLAYVVWVDEIPYGYHVHHRCGNTLCIEPSHLEAVSPAEHAERHADEVARAIRLAIAESARQNRALTHCVNGHEFTAENTWTRKEGWRQCRVCLRDRARARRAKAGA